MAPPPADSLIAALLAAVLGVFTPATGFVVTVLRPAPTMACRPAGGMPSARDLVAPTSTAGTGSSDWQELATTLSGELADSDDPEARKLAQAIGDTGTPDTADPPTTRTRGTAVPRTGAPGAAPRSPARSATPGPSAARARPGTGPCPAPSGPIAPATRTPSAAPSGGQRWEQLAGRLAGALAGSTDPRAVDLREALDRAGLPASRPTTTAGRVTGAAPRTTSTPVPDDPGGGG